MDNRYLMADPYIDHGQMLNLTSERALSDVVKMTHIAEMTTANSGKKFEVAIVGCGLGGLACAIACTREGANVTIFEQAKELSEIGAGIVLPPNVNCIMDQFGLIDTIERSGAVRIERYTVFDYQTGKLLAARPGSEWARSNFGYCWYVIHRADYQRLLWDEAERLGVKLRLSSSVVDLDCRDIAPSLRLVDGETIEADVIVLADGVQSKLRKHVVGYSPVPTPVGDIAYRATISRETLAALNNPRVQELIEAAESSLWWGPHSHVMFYPIRNAEEFNLVLLCPDNMPPNISKEDGDVAEMRAQFAGWDPVLQLLISTVDRVIKWRLHHMEELEKWVEGSVVGLGDACHPTPPYQAQGAAMAVEDGAALGTLLGLRQRSSNPPGLPSVSRLYEEMRKKRTALQLKGALENRDLYHLYEERDVKSRNSLLETLTWDATQQDFPWLWGNMDYQMELNDFDAIESSKKAFRDRFETQHSD